MDFYNVKKRKKVAIPDQNVSKIVYGTNDRPRYAVRATDDDGTKLTKFVSKETFDGLDAPMEKQ